MAKRSKHGIHYARYSRSKRLQRVVSLMSDGRRRSTLTIQSRARVCNAHTCVSELRAQGFKFPKAEREFVKGEVMYFYQLPKAA